MIAWRICKRKYATREIVLAGLGARAEGGRWNRAGIAAIYASENSSLALLETLAHTDITLLPKSLVAVRIEVPDDAPVRRVSERSLGKSWREPEDERCAQLGSTWLTENTELVLSVPSAVNPIERNMILNPQSPQIARCNVLTPIPIRYDERLLALFYPE